MTICLTSCGSKDIEKETEIVKIPVETVQAEKGTFNKAVILSGITQPKSEVIVSPKIMSAEKIILLNLEVGDKVAQGQTLAVLDQSTVAIQLDNARITYEDMSKNYERNKILYEMGAISPQQWEQIELGLKQAKNALEAQQIAFDNTIIKAPISGVITAVMAEEGALASAQTPICSIADISTLEIEASINELQVNKLKAGQKVQVYIPSAGPEVVEGQIKSINPVMDQKIKAYPLTITIPNQKGQIKAGMYGEVEIITDTRKDVIIVPAEAVVSRDDVHKVFVIQDDKAVMKLVELGLSNGKKTEILKGLNPGEEVITTGNEDIVAGDLVTVVNRGEK